MDWRYRAACRDEDPELFFPIGSSGPALMQIQEAKAVCDACPVRSRCAEFGFGEYDGVWGGLSPAERRRANETDRPGTARTGTASNGTARTGPPVA